MEAIGNTLYPIVALTMLIGLVARIRTAIGEPDKLYHWPMCGSYAGLGITFTIATPVIWDAVDRATGIPNIANLLCYIAVLAYTACTETLLLYWSHPVDEAKPRVRTRIRWFMAIVPVLVLLFILAGTDESGSRSSDFNAHVAGRHLALDLYIALYIAAFGAGQIHVMRLALAYSRKCSLTWVRRGLRVMAVSSALGIVYCLARAGDVVGARLGVDPHQWEAVPKLASGLGAVVFAVGLTLPGWATTMAAPQRWLRRVRAYRELGPMWEELTRAVPSVRLTALTASWATLLTPRGAELMLYRRIIEIMDAVLILRPRFDPDIAHRARTAAQRSGLAPEQCEAVAEAAHLAGVLSGSSRRHGDPSATSTKPSPACPDRPEWTRRSNDCAASPGRCAHHW